jgi:hypothetical protein
MPGTAKHKNFGPGSALALGIDAVTTTITVADITKFSSDGSFTVRIDDSPDFTLPPEYVFVPQGGIAGNTFGGVTRHVEGSAPASHLSGATVTQVETYGSAFQLWPNFVFIDTISAPYTAKPQEFVPCDSSGGTFAVTLPLAATAGPNCPVGVCDIGPGSGITVVPSGGDTLISAWIGTLQQQTALFISDGINEWHPVSGTGRISAFPDLGPPRPTITAAYTLLASEVWELFDVGSGPYAINLQNAVPGRLIRLQHGNAQLIEFAGITVSRGTATFAIEHPVFRTLATTAPLNVSAATYEYMLDSRSNILRCMRPIR